MIEDYFVDCVKRVKTEDSDGLGGVNTAWVDDSATFKAGIAMTADTPTTIADKQGSVKQYNIAVKDVTLSAGERVKRVSDAREFTVTSDSADRTTPDIGGVIFSYVTAEEVSA